MQIYSSQYHYIYLHLFCQFLYLTDFRIQYHLYSTAFRSDWRLTAFDDRQLLHAIRCPCYPIFQIIFLSQNSPYLRDLSRLCHRFPASLFLILNFFLPFFCRHLQISGIYFRSLAQNMEDEERWNRRKTTLFPGCRNGKETKTRMSQISTILTCWKSSAEDSSNAAALWEHQPKPSVYGED